MGRKSAKGKEKKLRRKEVKKRPRFTPRIIYQEQASLAASQVVVDAANALDDPMESFASFKKYDRNGLNLTIECCRSTKLDQQTLDWAFNLTKKNMQALYEASKKGWRPREKQDEMTDDRAWYLIARETDDTPVGLIHFRFDMDFDDEVVYCYEIQLVESVRRKGLGKFLMQILSLLAHKTHMKKVMLTVFKENVTAFNFFKNTLKYEIDETSPSIFDSMNEEDYDYEIMSRTMPQKKASQPVQES